MSQTEKHKPDRRTPQQLAKAILDHEFTPASLVRMTFREQLLHDHLTRWEKEHANKLLWGLKRMEGGETPDRAILQDFCHGLLAISAYKKASRELKDMNKTDSSSEPDTTIEERISLLVNEGDLRPPPTDYNKEENEDLIRDYALEINNLNHIEKLFRTLAKKLHIDLIEPPGQAASR